MDPSAELRHFFEQVGRSAGDRLKEYQSRGALFETTYVTAERRPREHRYILGMCEVEVATVPFTRSVWVWKDRPSFLNDVVASTPELAQGIELLVATCARSVDRLGRTDEDYGDMLYQMSVDRLTSFIQGLADRLLGGPEEVWDDIITEAVDSFVGDLSDERPRVRAKAYLRCLWLLEDSFVVAEGAVLRRPTLDDYVDRRGMESVSWYGSESEVAVYPTAVGAILEVEAGRCTPSEARDKVERVLNLVRLDKVVSLSVERLEVRSDSFLYPVQETEGEGAKNILYHAILDTKDLEELAYMGEALLPALEKVSTSRQEVGVEGLRSYRERLRSLSDETLLSPQDEHAGHKQTMASVIHEMTGHLDHSCPYAGSLGRDDSPDPVNLSLRHYLAVLSEYMAVDERIARTITCLEALYLKEDRRGLSSKGLQLRAASILEDAGYDLTKAYRDLFQGYRVRSQFYNGESSELSMEERRGLCESLIEYARTSLVVFLQVRERIPKEEFIDILDRFVQGELTEAEKERLGTIRVNNRPSSEMLLEAIERY